MITTIDDETGEVTVQDGPRRERFPLASPEGFAMVSRAWLRAGWDAKYVYSFTWLGRPIIQLPEDMLRLQEVIFHLRPDVIVETGIAHGGGLVFYASLCKALGKGRVIGIDLDIRMHNRAAIEAHELFGFITLIEGSSTAAETVSKVRSGIRPGENVLVLLDSDHSKAHVLAELDAYAPLVSIGSYIVPMDGIMSKLSRAPRSKPDWEENNPLTAVQDWVAARTDFRIEEPPFAFNEGLVRERVTYWPNAFVRRIS